MRPVFIDTGYLLALEFANDQNHAVAKSHWQALLDALPTLITTSYVFDETVTFFNSRGYHAKAVEVGNTLLTSPSVHLIQVDEPLFQQGWKLFQQYQDKRYSLTDCISFATMLNQGIDDAMTFDRHFAQAGFQMLPGQTA
ncbi:MAG: type II toxin-antitoxin system VapC family toxin [Candidatus Competibacteraceae bacterium]|nr:type II toxin-antitoxin system VapC family toxin [Candidatus Competibacteraceae bacterium]